MDDIELNDYYHSGSLDLSACGSIKIQKRNQEDGTWKTLTALGNLQDRKHNLPDNRSFFRKVFFNDFNYKYGYKYKSEQEWIAAAKAIYDQTPDAERIFYYDSTSYGYRKVTLYIKGCGWCY